MPDPDGTITAGSANVATPGPTPVAPDIDANLPSGIPQISPVMTGDTASSQVVPPPPPTQQPTFFRRLLFSLGKGLLEGTQAGLMAPQNAQGPSIAAATAINRPMQMHQAMTSQQMDDLNVAMTQLKLHQLHTIVNQMEDEQQNAVYNRGRDTLDALMEKGKADVLATGDLKSVQDEYAKRQADAKEAGQGLLPIQILPSVGSSAKAPQYSLVMVGKDRLTDNMDETWGASDLGVDQKDFDAAGLTKFSFHASKGMDQQKALQLKTTQYLNWLTKASNQLGAWKRAQLLETGRNKRASAANDVRMRIADLNNITRRAIADKKAADQTGDKLKISALGKLVTAAKNFGDAQGKISNKAWNTLTDAETKELTTKRTALDAAKKEYDDISQKQSKAVSDLKQAVGSTAVAKGTLITKAIASEYKLKAGGDVVKAKQMAAADGYVWQKPGAAQ